MSLREKIRASGVVLEDICGQTKERGVPTQRL